MAIPVLIGKWLTAGLFASVGAFAGRVFTALGIGWVTYNFAMPQFTAYFQQLFGGVGALPLQVIGYLQLDIFVTMVLSAIATKFAMRMVLRRAL